MKRTRRSSEQIMIEILRKSSNSIVITQLMRYCNINYNHFRRLCGFLEEKGFLARTKPIAIHSILPTTRADKRIKFLYKITDKGSKLIMDIDSSDISELYEYHKWLRGSVYA